MNNSDMWGQFANIEEYNIYDNSSMRGNYSSNIPKFNLFGNEYFFGNENIKNYSRNDSFYNNEKKNNFNSHQTLYYGDSYIVKITINLLGFINYINENLTHW